MLAKALLLALAADRIAAFPWVVNVPGVESSMLHTKRVASAAALEYQKRQICVFNSNHTGAVPFNPKYPYTGARNGMPGSGVGGFQVPMPGDTAHYFVAPDYSKDIRGPCPGLNAAANHNFLSHDGITTYNELVDMQQNLYNVGYDLANILAVAGVGLDGDVVTSKVSIGCDATPRTAAANGLLGDELGLNGHNKFEGDVSLTRNDYFLVNGDNHNFNGTLFGYMQNTCQGNFNLANLALYRAQRYNQSLAENGNFFFGPGSVLLYGAASFLYELFPSGGNLGTPDLATISSFFGTTQQSDGTWEFNGMEKIPDNWSNRVQNYTASFVGEQIGAMYQAYPVNFGGNVGQNNFLGLNYSSYITNGKFNVATAKQFTCLLYQLSTAGVPSSLSHVGELPQTVSEWAVNKLFPFYKDLGCPDSLVMGNQG